MAMRHLVSGDEDQNTWRAPAPEGYHPGGDTLSFAAAARGFVDGSSKPLPSLNLASP